MLLLGILSFLLSAFLAALKGILYPCLVCNDHKEPGGLELVGLFGFEQVGFIFRRYSRAPIPIGAMGGQDGRVEATLIAVVRDQLPSSP